MAAYDRETLLSAQAVTVRLHRELGPLADFEFKAAFDAAWSGTCDESLHRQARRTARDAGHIRDSGQRRRNPVTHRYQVVWEYCELPPLEIPRCPTCGMLLRRQRKAVEVTEDADTEG